MRQVRRTILRTQVGLRTGSVTRARDRCRVGPLRAFFFGFSSRRNACIVAESKTVTMTL